jgi:hypothetical protein
MSRSQLSARALYLIGSLVFLLVSLSRGSVALATGSALFVAGSLLMLKPQRVSTDQERRSSS